MMVRVEYELRMRKLKEVGLQGVVYMRREFKREIWVIGIDGGNVYVYIQSKEKRRSKEITVRCWGIVIVKGLVEGQEFLEEILK